MYGKCSELVRRFSVLLSLLLMRLKQLGSCRESCAPQPHTQSVPASQWQLISNVVTLSTRGCTVLVVSLRLCDLHLEDGGTGRNPETKTHCGPAETTFIQISHAFS